MKALQYTAFGGPENLALSEIAEPEPAENQVRVKVTTVGLNPMDWMIMGNAELAKIFQIKLPQTFAYDFAGVVEAIGSSVTDFTPGERVFGSSFTGAAAEEILMTPSEGMLFKTPAGVSDEVAASLGVPALTAKAALRNAKVKAGDIVLVGGAAGGVGVFVIQLAKIMEAKVIGTASDSSADFLAQFGAEQVRYGAGLAERLTGKKITAAIDLFSREVVDTAISLGVPAEKISTTIHDDSLPAGVTDVNAGSGTAVGQQDMQEVLAEIVAGKLTVPIAAKYDWHDFQAAVAQQKDRHAHGKIIMTL